MRLSIISFISILLISSCSKPTNESRENKDVSTLEVETESWKGVPDIDFEKSTDKNLPTYVWHNENTILYRDKSLDSDVVTTLEEDAWKLIALSTEFDEDNQLWHYVYYPDKDIIAWSNQLDSDMFLSYDDKTALFVKNYTLASLQLGANVMHSKHLLGTPLEETVEKKALEAEGVVYEDEIIEVAKLKYEGIELTYIDGLLKKAILTAPSKSFGYLTIDDESCDKQFVQTLFEMKESDATTDDGSFVIMTEVRSVNLYFDENELIQKLEFNWYY